MQTAHLPSRGLGQVRVLSGSCFLICKRVKYFPLSLSRKKTGWLGMCDSESACIACTRPWDPFSAQAYEQDYLLSSVTPHVGGREQRIRSSSSTSTREQIPGLPGIPETLPLKIRTQTPQCAPLRTHPQASLSGSARS